MEIIHSLLSMTYEMATYILLGLFIAGLLQAFVSSESMSRHLSSPGWKSVVKSALIGVPLPLCSCGVLPTAVALRRSGASKAATSSFLISTPQTGVDSIAATWSLLGPAFAVIRPIAAMTTAIGGGLAVGKDESTVADCDAECPSGECCAEKAEAPKTFWKKMIVALRYGFFDMIQSIGGWLTIGLIIAALITVLVPADAFAVLADKPILAMLAVLAVSVPMYVCATGSIPIALALMLKGLSPGTAFVLLMAGPACNVASIAILTRTLGRRSAIIYLISIIVGAMGFGLAIDYLLPREWFPMQTQAAHACCHDSASVFSMLCAGVLAILLVVAFTAKWTNSYKAKHIKPSIMTKQYKITGMNCSHCQKSVQKAIEGVAGVTSVTVDLAGGVAHVEGSQNDADVIKAVEAAGFEATTL